MIAHFSGPYSLTDAEIQRTVPDSVGGVFVFGLPNAGGGLGVIAAIGRCAADLRFEIRRGVGRYQLFLFTACSTARAAFELESRLFHRLGHRPDLRHPATLPDAGWSCPVCAPDGRMIELPRACHGGRSGTSPSENLHAVALPAARPSEPSNAPGPVRAAVQG